MMAVLALVGIGLASGYNLERLNLMIKENGEDFTETVYIDPKNRYEIIGVPAHGERTPLTVVRDFVRNHSIYKMDAQKKCYVVPLEKDEEKPMDLKDSMQKMKMKFPISSYVVEHPMFIPDGPMDLDSAMGRMAAKFCGDFEIVEATTYTGDVDVEQIAKDKLKKVFGKHDQENEKRQVVVSRNFAMACNQAQVENSLSQCPESFMTLIPKCRFQTDTCIYTMRCQYAIPNGTPTVTCNPAHRLHTVICCSYYCP